MATKRKPKINKKKKQKRQLVNDWIKRQYHTYQSHFNSMRRTEKCEENVSVSVKYQKNQTDRGKERKCLAIKWEWGGGSKTRGQGK